MTTSSNVLIVDQDRDFTRKLSRALSQGECLVFFAPDLPRGLRMAHQRDMDIIFLDLDSPEINAGEMVKQFKSLPGSPEIIVITSSLDSDNAAAAIQQGAWDFISKSSTPLQMKLSCQRAAQYRSKRLSLFPIERSDIVGSSPALMSCLEEMAKAARTNAEVLFTGETGTGKEVFARALHANSQRSDKNLVIVDCASLTESLAESELFGYRKGAFTGAVTDKTGMIYQANRGTLFLDEISELPLSMQKNLLRVLESQTYRPLGQSHESVSNFRLISASNRDLDTMSRNSEFREDLLFRIQAVRIDIPPLRQRLEDIEDLSSFHLKKIARESQLPKMTASPDLIELFQNYSWPGNVRELVNTLKALSSTGLQERVLHPSHLPRELHSRFLSDSSHSLEIQDPSSTAPSPSPPSNSALNSGSVTVDPDWFHRDWKTFCAMSREKYESQYLQNLMQVCENSIDDAVCHSGLSKPRLYSLLKKYSIPRPTSKENFN